MMKWLSAIVGMSLLVAGLGTASETGTVASAVGEEVFRPCRAIERSVPGLKVRELADIRPLR